MPGLNRFAERPVNGAGSMTQILPREVYVDDLRIRPLKHRHANQCIEARIETVADLSAVFLTLARARLLLAAI